MAVDQTDFVNMMQRPLPLPPSIEDDTNHYGDTSLRGILGFPYQSQLNHCKQLIAAGGAFQAIDESIGFLAHTVIINNYSTQWFRIEAANCYVPPSVIGFCVPLYQGTQNAKITPETPTGLSSTVTNGQICEAVYTAWQLPYSPGISAAGGTSVSISGSLPAGNNVIGHVITDTGSTTVVSSITAALPAGGNTIGGVNVIAALPAGGNTIGGVNVIAALPAGGNTIGGVNVIAALPSGTNAIGDVGARQYTAPATGERAGATSATQFANVPCHFAKFKASAANTGKVYIGISGVTKAAGTTTTTAGLQLSAGDDSGWFPIDNLNRMFLICDNTTDNVTYAVMN